MSTVELRGNCLDLDEGRDNDAGGVGRCKDPKFKASLGHSLGSHCAYCTLKYAEL